MVTTTSAGPRPPLTTRSTPKLSEAARHLVLPAGIVSTGWPSVRDTCANIGVGFDPWQDGAGRAILGKGADGLYAADAVVMSIPRQVGKTYLIGWLCFALCLIFPGLTILWTAHRYKTATETFASLRGMSQRRRVKPHISKVTQGAGDQVIYFRNGSRILFGARERGFGRGFSDVDVEVFDEAQILTEAAIDDMVPATNVAANPLIIYVGTPPKPTDPGEVFTRHRVEALSGESTDELYVELSADADADALDREQWAKANPSYPHRTTERAMLRMLKNLTPDAFLREGLGIWDELGKLGPISPAAWRKCLDAASARAGAPALAVDVSPDRSHAAVSMAALNAEGLPMIQVVRHGPGVDWVAKHVGAIVKDKDATCVVVDSVGPVSNLKDDIAEAIEGVPLLVMTTGDVCDAWASLYDAVTDSRGPQVRHLGQAELDEALKAATVRMIGTRKAWDAKSSGADITSLISAGHAMWGLSQAPGVFFASRR
jgi:hypothetical protein